MVVEEVIVHRNNIMDIALAIPSEGEPLEEDPVSLQTLANVQTLKPSLWGSFWTRGMLESRDGALLHGNGRP